MCFVEKIPNEVSSGAELLDDLESHVRTLRKTENVLKQSVYIALHPTREIFKGVCAYTPVLIVSKVRHMYLDQH